MIKNAIKKYLFLKLDIVKKLHENYKKEQSAIFEQDKRQMQRIFVEREKYLSHIAIINQKIAYEMDQNGIFALKPKKYPLTYRLEKKIENSIKEVGKKNAANKMMLQFITMNS